MSDRAIGGGALRDAERTLARAAVLIRYALYAVGAAVAAGQLGPFVADGQFTWGERRVAGLMATVTIGGFGLAGWAVGAFLRGVGALVGAIGDAVEAAGRAGDLIETRLVPAVERLSNIMEGGRSGDEVVSEGARVEIRRAIGAGRWGRAEAIIEGVGDDATRGALHAELADAKEAEASDVRRRLEEALASEDADAAIAARDLLTRHIRGAELRDLDARLARWLVGWVRGRVRRGAFTAGLAGAAARGADRFGDTAEGRSLLASVPDLRRRAGLCATCARPYRGEADACPACSGPARTRPASHRAGDGLSP